MILTRLHPDSFDRAPDDSVMFLDRPAVPEFVRATDIAPQFCSESLRIDALRTGRRLPLIERFLEGDPFAA